MGDRLGRLARRMLGDRVVRSGWKRDPAGDRYIVELKLHAGMPSATLAVEPSAELVLRGETGDIGPGYHVALAACASPLLDELDVAWTDQVDLTAVQRQMCSWLADELRRGTSRFGIAEHRHFRIEQPILTALGPRDAAWRDAVLADPSRAADAFPWWDTGPGRAERARALISMWHEVPWREPLDPEERDLMERVDTDLRAARDADPALELPWAAWRELLSHLGIDDEDATAKAARTSAAIGYRRYDLDVELSGGWSIVLPAAMAGHWEGDGERYWATDGDRLVEFSSLTATGETDSDRLLAVAPEKHPVIARRDDGPYRGRAEAFDDDDVHVVIGLVAKAPHVGILTCKAVDDAWALATWRTLRHEG